MTQFTRRNVLQLGGFIVLARAMPLVAGTNRVATDKAGLAIDGYDTHAYWRHGAALDGVDAHVVTWRGVAWRFATADDANIFTAMPDAFAPKFGGFCTRAMSFRKIVNGDPEVWRIYQGSLYLFAKPVGGRKFDKGQDPMITKAQAYWDTLD